MSSSKTIQFNPAFFSGSGKVKSPTNKREKKEKPEVSVKPNKMKKQLLAKIKDFQNNTEKEGVKKREEEEEFDKGFADEFNKSLNFLSELSKQRKQKPNRNETLKKGKVEHAVHLQISTELPEELKLEPMRINPMPKIAIIKPHAQQTHAQQTHAQQTHAQRTQAQRVQQAQQTQAPMQAQQTQTQAQQTQAQRVQQAQAQVPTLALKPNPMYSNLKGGSRPTYRQYHNKTQKNYGNEPVVKPLIQIENVPAALVPAALVPAALVPAAGNVPVAASNSTPTLAKKPRFKKRITRTLKYSLGKHKNGKVSVLIKNAKTRRKVQTEQALLKQKSIPDIKLYLRSKNLLKVGSDVPNDVLRQMYESAILAGDVTNKSKDTLIHNFLNEK